MLRKSGFILMKTLNEQFNIVSALQTEYNKTKKTRDPAKIKDFILKIETLTLQEQDNFSVKILTNTKISDKIPDNIFFNYLQSELRICVNSLTELKKLQSQKFNGIHYNFIKELGHGGNGTVYLIEDPKTNNKFALKLLHQKNNKPTKKLLQRFIDEISVVTNRLSKCPGVLPICQYHIQNLKNPNDKYSWYTMPVAQSITKYSFKNIEEKIKAFLQLAQTLEYLHNNNITHRDIKPDNLYLYNNNFVFSDFGLTDFPQKIAKTGKKEKVGPWLTIAPEMERDIEHADFKAADVYSFAKSFWIILTNNYNCFEGQYSYTTEYMDLSKHITTRKEYDNGTKIYLAPLHELLFKCTSNKPEERLNAKEIIQYLKGWFIFSKNHEKGDTFEWHFLKKQLFKYPVDKCTWNKSNQIFNVLELITRTPYLNHTFFPGGGGLYLNNVSVYEDDYLEFDFNGFPYIGKPKLLEFHSFNNPLFNYFYLELDESSEIYQFKYTKINPFEESVCELSKGYFVESWYVNYIGSSYGSISVPKSAREVVLLNKGVYVIFCQSSPYNKYDSVFGFDSYSAYQTRFKNAKKFEDFVSLFHNEFEIYRYYSTNELLSKIREANKKKYPPQTHFLPERKEKRRTNEVNSFLCNSTFYFNCNYDKNAIYNYYLEINIDLKNYAFSVNNNFIEYDQSFNLSEAVKKISELKQKEKLIKYFSDKDEVYSLIRNIKKILRHHFKKEFDMPIFSLRGKFIKLPSKRYFSENDLKNALMTGDDLSNNYITITPKMEIKCINENLINAGTRGIYFFIDSNKIFKHNNICGNKSLSQFYITEKYKELLAHTSVLLKCVCGIKSDFDIEFGKDIKVIQQEIKKL